ncbi:MAG: DegV family protein [Clostridia bacterium]|nr:DegV family protein [Clostridia bacterium]
MRIAITADDTCDLPQELIQQNNIILSYIPNILGEDEYRGGLTSDMIYDYVDKTGELPQTAAASSFNYKELFEKALETHDAVIHFALSSGISSTCRNAQKAASELENVFVIDTQSLSSGSGLLVLSACDKVKAGMPIQQIVEEINEESKRVQASFLISKLNYLRKGGRCSSVAAFGANLLGLKILIQLQDGKMNATKKYMGKIEGALSKYLKDMVAECPPDMGRVFITSSSKMPGVREGFVEEVKALGFKEVYVSDAGSTICSHCGPGTIGVIYMKKQG